MVGQQDAGCRWIARQFAPRYAGDKTHATNGTNQDRAHGYSITASGREVVTVDLGTAGEPILEGLTAAGHIMVPTNSRMPSKTALTSADGAMQRVRYVPTMGMLWLEMLSP
jgi:hypothetical protein